MEEKGAGPTAWLEAKWGNKKPLKRDKARFIEGRKGGGGVRGDIFILHIEGIYIFSLLSEALLKGLSHKIHMDCT